MAAEVGSRVIAVRDSDLERIYVFGWGVYEGEFPNPYIAAPITLEEARQAAPSITQPMTDEELQKRLDRVNNNPRIRLDSGETVWGCECWWCPETEWTAKMAGDARPLITVSLREFRETTGVTFQSGGDA